MYSVLFNKYGMCEDDLWLVETSKMLNNLSLCFLSKLWSEFKHRKRKTLWSSRPWFCSRHSENQPAARVTMPLPSPPQPPSISRNWRK